MGDAASPFVCTTGPSAQTRVLAGVLIHANMGLEAHMILTHAEILLEELFYPAKNLYRACALTSDVPDRKYPENFVQARALEAAVAIPCTATDCSHATAHNSRCHRPQEGRQESGEEGCYT